MQAQSSKSLAKHQQNQYSRKFYRFPQSPTSLHHSTMNTITIMLIATALMFLIERIWPANELPKTKNWWLRVILTNTAQAGVVILLGFGWDAWIANQNHPWALRNHLSLPLQITVAYITTTFIYYWWHRIRHESKFFWKLCHQLHHSPARMEVLMSFYKHPVEITINALLSSIITYPLLGCSIEAAALTTLATGIAELFYHWNIKTPQWLGPFFQRPESHRVHHQRFRHTNNYSDIPLWDILFGTYKNPKKQIKQCGFTPERESRFQDILAFRDVNTKDNDTRPPINLLCLGCKKRYACHQAKPKNP